jgi:hypothetical protein
MISEINEERPEIQYDPINVTEAGIVSADNDEHPEIQEYLRDVTELGIHRFVKFWHFSKQ